MTYYLKKKNEIRKIAKDFQRYITKNNIPWWDYMDPLDEIEKEARKYGLIKELKKEGVLQ